jgi:hypothetical protein
MQFLQWSASLGLLLIFLVVPFSGCTTLDRRNDFFLSQPLWESKKLLLTSKQVPTRSGIATNGRTLPDLLKIVANDAPGLAMLGQQVFRVELERSGAREAVLQAIQASFDGTQKYILTYDSEPLPPQLASLPVTKAFIGERLESHLRTLPGFSAEDSLQSSIPDRLTLGDFRDFADTLAKTSLYPYQTTPEAEVAPRTKQFTVCKDEKRLTWQCLFVTYLTAFYNGAFVDRNGGTYTKPKIGLTITNETITAFAAVFIEATMDFAIIDARHWKAPIVYTSATDVRTIQWHTKGNNKPTLVDVAIKFGGVDPAKPEWGYVIQEAKNGIGMNPTKLCVARLLGGEAGDAAQSLTGSAVRFFGGTNIGFVVLGKFSFGDNETLARVIDTLLENFPRRLTEGALQHVLYEIDFSKPEANKILASLISVAESLAGCKEND